MLCPPYHYLRTLMHEPSYLQCNWMKYKMAAGDHHHHILIMLIYSWCANHVITFIPCIFSCSLSGERPYRPVVRSSEASSACHLALSGLAWKNYWAKAFSECEHNLIRIYLPDRSLKRYHDIISERFFKNCPFTMRLFLYIPSHC